MSDTTTRRTAIQAIAAAVAAGTATIADAQHVHQRTASAAETAGGAYKPRLFQPSEWETLKKLCELIVPGASQGGAAEYIDLLASNNRDLEAIWTGGLAWLDHTMQDRVQKPFRLATVEEQKMLLDVIAFRRNREGGMGPGVAFFRWARRMTVDAYYSSPAGVKDLDYRGNKGMARFEVPAEAIDYAVERSGVA
jgi:hypothetical protein